MGLTLVAIVTAALLLPGIIAARAFFFAGQTREVEVAVPPLSTPNGISLVGGFSILVHGLYVAGLRIASGLPPYVPLPLADPYRPFIVTPVGEPALDVAWSFLSGLILLSILAVIVGWLAGRVAIAFVNKALVYGPLADVIDSANGDDKFITAYILTKMGDAGRLLGYQGTVDSLFRDDDRFPIKVVLREVAPFYLVLGPDGPERVEGEQQIDWIVLRAEDWHNIAFRVFQLVEDRIAGSPDGAAI